MTVDHLSSLSPAAGSRRKRKRVGRGQGSGHGKTATRGEKGAGSRSGSGRRAWFEGGQMPLARRVPKHGFHSPFRTEYQVVNLATLAKLVSEGRVENGIVTPESLRRIGLIKKAAVPVKVLGMGELTSQLDITAHAFSASAREKIVKAGGKVTTLNSSASE